MPAERPRNLDRESFLAPFLIAVALLVASAAALVAKAVPAVAGFVGHVATGARATTGIR